MGPDDYMYLIYSTLPQKKSLAEHQFSGGAYFLNILKMLDDEIKHNNWI